MLLILFAGLAFWSMAQEISLQGSPSSLSILPGAPAEFELTVRNMSGKPLTLVGQTLQSALFPNGLPGGTLYDSSGKAVRCSGMSGGLVVKGNKPPCETPTVVFPASGSLTLNCGIYSQGSCPLRDVPPGNYTGKVIIEVQACEGGQSRAVRQMLEIPVTVKAPQGEDAAYLQALEKTVNEAPPKFSGPYKGPLKWMEVVDSPRIHSRNIVLQRFPASTYAGYALLAPGGECIPDPRVFLMNLLVNDETAQRWPQTASQMDSEKKKAIEDDKKRVEQLEGYLKARPDFAKADALKVELAGRFAALERFQEAQAICGEITAHDAASIEAGKARMLIAFLAKKGCLKAVQ